MTSTSPLPYEVHVCHVGRATNKSAHDPETVSEKGKVRLKSFCAINILTVSFFLVSIGLGVAAILIGDGTALVSITTMSFSSSLACLSQRSYPEIFRMPINHGRQPPGDLVIRTKNGAYIVVHCTEDIFRELYQKRETYSCVFERYQGLTRMLLGSSTVLLMASVLLFSNCGWIMQTAIAATYIILNLAYWATSVLIDGGRFWDLGALYTVSDERLRRGHDHISALWAAIQETEEVEWTLKTGITPNTKNWRGWLREAKEDINNTDWDTIEAKDRWMGTTFDTPGIDEDVK